MKEESKEDEKAWTELHVVMLLYWVGQRYKEKNDKDEKKKKIKRNKKIKRKNKNETLVKVDS